jgi:hypothetical protein
MRTRLVTGRQAADLLDVPPKRVAVWIERGHVQPIGMLRGRSRGGQGIPLFELDDFAELAGAYHRRRGTPNAGPCSPLPDEGG